MKPHVAEASASEPPLHLGRAGADEVATLVSDTKDTAPGRGARHRPGENRTAVKMLVDEDEVGTGGTSLVRRVFDPTLDRHLAMKLLSPQLARKSRQVARFVREAQIMARLDHPNVVPIHDLVIDPRSGPFFTMKLVDGETLHDRVRATPGAGADPAVLGSLLEVFLKVCDVVAFAHSRGICHCDLKPENIMVGAFGQVYLMDWGIASAIADGVEVDQPQASGRPAIRGTPSYMAPEQALGRPELIDERTDVFGLGGVLHFICVGSPPFPGNANAQSVLRARRIVAFDGLAVVPPALQQIIRKAVSPRIEDRYASALELRAEVEGVLRGAWHLPTRLYQPGARILTEGDTGDSAFVILSGNCVVSKTVGGKRRVVRHLGPGEVFGETAVLAGCRRTATVEAEDEVLLRVVTWESLRGQLGVGTDLGRFVAALADRFCQMDARLSAYEALLRRRRARPKAPRRQRRTKPRR